MNPEPLKKVLFDLFTTLLKYSGGLLMAHRLISPEAAQGWLSYAEPLASITLVVMGHYFQLYIQWLHSASARTEIQFLREKINHITALADAKLEHDFSAYTSLHPEGEAFVDRRAPSSVSKIQSQQSTPKL